ncbi:hypothetical protein SAMN05720766_10696 [Fibrobacter sp. UWH9]|uniref:hypothetical protein n=1 Tax=unclassified Fibrobacter TaxID=2634177 RepID=UPI0009170E2E|nr:MULTISPECIES: hypothetical protein [Fibrobacter]MCQ2100579.1 hypothetical protein [Fibrobacter sp.]MCL4101358.1 hypothetical protein [Fibrobacter succinogenes]MDO4945968.1 hypothetical protein [Fibrobacter sp.]OWV07633.1 hypothetical protein B7993_01960 [Fibrobacter sp. UWH3]OWV17444.1 hypothetical protein B7992_00855 [Fibrobacter sp. UWH1]
MRRLVPAAFVAALLAGCASHPSPQQTMVDDRHLVYVDMYKAYRKAEEDYLNLLFNIERMPEEEELWMMKREKMLELNQLKEFMLNARQELDEAMRLWEMHLLDVQADLKQAQLKAFNPNFKGEDAQRTSPGQLLPNEANQIHK